MNDKRLGRLHAALERSAELHDAVRAYAKSEKEDAHRFAELAAEIAEHQAHSCAPLARLAKAWSSRSVLPGVVPVPADGFRYAQIFAFAASAAEACFQTSGTTALTTGRHWLRTTDTYRELAAAFGRQALLRSDAEAEAGQRVVLALMPDLGATPKSSLGFMAACFMESFDGAALDPGRRRGGFSLSEPGRWLLDRAGIDLDSLRRGVGVASEAGQPVLLLTTSFALVMLLDQLGERSLRLPAGSVVMTTGGFKGRTRELSRDELHGRAMRQLAPEAIVSEYGMTELSSQLYEGVVPGAALVGPPGIYLEPNTLRVFVLDPRTLRPVANGEPGLACFVDLANVDSAVCVLTQDLVRREGAGIRLLGRAPRAELRGCSLVAESIALELGAAKLESAVVKPVAGSSAARVKLEPHDPTDPALPSKASARVRRLIEAAQHLQDPKDVLGQQLRLRLRASTGLSPEAIDLGLTKCLETDVADQDLFKFCGAVSPARRAWVVLSANVFVAAHRAIALALASSSEVFVRASSREPVFAEVLREATLRHDPNAPLFQIIPELAPDNGDVVFAYGSDETMSALQRSFPEGVQFHPHGSGFGAVLVFPEADLEHTAQGIAADVVPFEQEGCLSPRIVLLPREVDAEALAKRLASALSEWANRVPPRREDPKYPSEQRWFEGLGHLAGRVYDASGSSILLQQEPAQLIVPPPGRNLTLYQVEDPVAIACKLGPGLTSLAVAGDDQRLATLAEQLPGVRVCVPGLMQCPPFDGPVDRRNLAVLSKR